jgi:hypothetical protein
MVWMKIEDNVRRLRGDDEFESLVAGHVARHSARQARIGLVVALAAFGLVLEAGLEQRLVLRRERRLLGAARRLVLIVAIAAAPRRPAHRSGPVGIA